MDKLDSIKEKLAKFVKERDWEKFHNPKDLAESISIEASELLELFQWKAQAESFGVAKDKKEELSSEMADILTYLVELSNITGIDLYDAFNKKMDLNEKRYPKELVKGKSNKYTYYQK